MSSFIARRSVIASISARAFSTTAPNNLARMNLIGHLAGTPEATATSNPNTEVIRYSVAISNGKDKPPSWFNVTALVSPEQSKKKDFLLGLAKGTMVHVDADASMASYKDNEGKNRTSLNIVQRSLEVLKRPKTEEIEQ
ncbi:hypothetical protein TD95_003430 [Thielaviopsis punctulata]|uniref:Single-stranded DNA-binding protein n=1 Tax=Thielaviopsis punctulata TaxID=72032 RepID=A0A0F4ZES3_9PEZI|nr:hypothetical protein TD95_003430 [Thielaviopsis punctulata]